MAYPVYDQKSAIKPGPQPGKVPPTNPSTVQTGNGRPRESQPSAKTISSPGQVQAAPPLPQVGFRMAWPGMNNAQAPQPQANIGEKSFNPLTGEWFLG